MRRHRLHFSLTLISLLVLAAPWAGAQNVVPQGVVSVTGASSDSDVTTLPTGEFVVVWASSYAGVYGAKIAPTGTPRTDFTVATYGYTSQSNPSVDSDDSGNFWVIWQEGFSGIEAAGHRGRAVP